MGTVWELLGGLRVQPPPFNVFNTPSCACLFVLGVRCNPIDRKNIKNTKFSWDPLISWELLEFTIRYGKVFALVQIYFSARGRLGVQDPLLEL